MAALSSASLAVQHADSDHLYAIPEYGWWIIASVAFALGMLSIALPSLRMEYPEDLRREHAERRKRIRWKGCLLVISSLAGFAVGVWRVAAMPETSEMLLLVSVLALSIPVVHLPIRDKLNRQIIAEQRDPDAKVPLGWRAQIWIYGVIVTAGMVAAILAELPFAYSF